NTVKQAIFIFLGFKHYKELSTIVVHCPVASFLLHDHLNDLCERRTGGGRVVVVHHNLAVCSAEVQIEFDRMHLVGEGELDVAKRELLSGNRMVMHNDPGMRKFV